MTLIVLLILAGVSINGLFSEKGLFKRTENASNRYNEAKAREVLETVLLTDGQYEKNTNKEYNPDDFLDKLIKSEIPGSNIKGDVAIIGEYAYELDRSVPKIGRYLGKASDLVWPTVTVSEPVLADDYRTSTFEVTAIEETNGINKIEIWFSGEKIETLTKTYDNIKTEIKENFTVNRNGKYIIKAYGDLMASAKVEVTGIVPSVEFSPNGSLEWKKEHTTKIIVKETGEKVTNLKYKWTTSGITPPAVEEFTENCPIDNIVTNGDDTMTGTYYLWILLTTQSNKTNICGSEGFNFDNKGPTVELASEPTSENSFTLTATASDTESGIANYEFYVGGVKVDTKTTNEGMATYTYVGTEMIERLECEVLVEDCLGNSSKATTPGRTKLHAWEVKRIISQATYERRAQTSDGLIYIPWNTTLMYSTIEPSIGYDGRIITFGPEIYVDLQPFFTLEKNKNLASTISGKYVWRKGGASIPSSSSYSYDYIALYRENSYATSGVGLSVSAVGYKIMQTSPAVYGNPEMVFSSQNDLYTNSGSSPTETWSYKGIM